jgi:hypothetical protein
VGCELPRYASLQAVADSGRLRGIRQDRLCIGGGGAWQAMLIQPRMKAVFPRYRGACFRMVVAC